MTSKPTSEQNIEVCPICLDPHKLQKAYCCNSLISLWNQKEESLIQLHSGCATKIHSSCRTTAYHKHLETKVTQVTNITTGENIKYPCPCCRNNIDLAEQLKLPYSNFKEYKEYTLKKQITADENPFFTFVFLMILTQIAFQMRLIIHYYNHDSNPEIQKVRVLSVLVIFIIVLFRPCLVSGADLVTTYKSWNKLFKGNYIKFATYALGAFLMTDFVAHINFVTKPPETINGFYLASLLPIGTLLLNYLIFMISGIRYSNVRDKIGIMTIHVFKNIFLLILLGFQVEYIFNSGKEFSETWQKILSIVLYIVGFILTILAYPPEDYESNRFWKSQRDFPIPYSRQLYFQTIGQFLEIVFLMYFTLHRPETQLTMNLYLFLPYLRIFLVWIIWINWKIIKHPGKGLTVFQDYLRHLIAVIFPLFYLIFPPIYGYEVIDPKVESHYRPECLKQPEHAQNWCLDNITLFKFSGFGFWFVYVLLGMPSLFIPLWDLFSAKNKNKKIMLSNFKRAVTLYFALLIPLITVIMLDQYQVVIDFILIVQFLIYISGLVPVIALILIIVVITFLKELVTAIYMLVCVCPCVILKQFREECDCCHCHCINDCYVKSKSCFKSIWKSFISCVKCDWCFQDKVEDMPNITQDLDMVISNQVFKIDMGDINSKENSNDCITRI